MQPMSLGRWFALMNSLATIWLLRTSAIAEPFPENEGGKVDAVESDFLFLEMRPTSLPGVQGYGVFTKTDLPSGELLCEMRGPIVAHDAPINSDKLYTLYSSLSSQNPIKLIVTNLCAYVNDCIDLNKVNFTIINGSVYVYETEPPTFDGFKYNTVDAVTKMGKVFLSSAMNIPAGSELCFFYGW
jgi:hypothetical protein